MVRAVLWLALLAVVRLPVGAQERRVAIPVDYVTGGDVYVALGTRDGLVQGDTVPVYVAAAGERRGVLLARVVTLRRAVLAFARDRFEVVVGDTLWLGLQRPAEPPAPAVQTPAPQAPGARGAPLPAPGSPGRAPAPRLDGRIALDVDAIQSDAFEGGTRRFTTPTLRLHAVAADLPGGFRLVTNLRVSRTASSDAAFEPMTSLRVYQAVAEKAFTRVPLRLQAGRFATALEPYGGYWDGLLARVGGERFGVGAAAGFLPSLANEGFSTDVPRASAFADFHTRGGRLRYDAELGVHALRPRATLADQTFVGLAQRLVWQGLLLSQSAQLDRNASAGWTLSALQVSATVPLREGLAARAGGSRYREADLGGPAPLPTFERDRGYFGLAYFGALLNLSTDLALTRLADGRHTRAWSTWVLLPHAVSGIGVGGGATLSRSESMNTTYLSGELSRTFGRAYVRTAFSTTRFARLVADSRSSGAEAAFTVPLTGSTQAMVRLETWWGTAGGARQRLLTSLWTGF